MPTALTRSVCAHAIHIMLHYIIISIILYSDYFHISSTLLLLLLFTSWLSKKNNTVHYQFQVTFRWFILQLNRNDYYNNIVAGSQLSYLYQYIIIILSTRLRFIFNILVMHILSPIHGGYYYIITYCCFNLISADAKYICHYMAYEYIRKKI